MSVAVTQQKRAGAYYTGEVVAQFLADWAIRSGHDRVLEPCFGQGVFLSAAQRRLRDLGGSGQVVGVDLDAQAFAAARLAFPRASLHGVDFFSLSQEDIGSFDAVIGNPPFIRYHHFSGETRRRALGRAAAAGAALPALASAWAPFLVHAATCLRQGGRLAMVAPFELTYARYARPVVEFLVRHFRSVVCLTFEAPLFPELSENTVLLLGDGFGDQSAGIVMRRLSSAAALGGPRAVDTRDDEGLWTPNLSRTGLFDLPLECRELYMRLASGAAVVRLGQVADITIGYVSGDNEYFHLGAGEAALYGLRPDDLTVAVRRSADLSDVGLELNRDDVERLANQDRHLLFCPQQPLDSAAQSYVSMGEAQGVHNRYKCRVRRPWYVVPSVRAPELLLTVFSSAGPRLVVNQAAVVASNGVLILNRVHGGRARARSLAAAAITTLAQLSAEIEGHALGGGVLKMEPSEARQWVLPAFAQVDESVYSAIDLHLRRGQREAAASTADDVFLKQGIGLSDCECAILRCGLVRLRSLRNRREPAAMRASSRGPALVD